MSNVVFSHLLELTLGRAARPTRFPLKVDRASPRDLQEGAQAGGLRPDMFVLSVDTPFSSGAARHRLVRGLDDIALLSSALYAQHKYEAAVFRLAAPRTRTVSAGAAQERLRRAQDFFDYTTSHPLLRASPALRLFFTEPPEAARSRMSALALRHNRAAVRGSAGLLQKGIEKTFKASLHVFRESYSVRARLRHVFGRPASRASVGGAPDVHEQPEAARAVAPDAPAFLRTEHQDAFQRLFEAHVFEAQGAMRELSQCAARQTAASADVTCASEEFAGFLGAAVHVCKLAPASIQGAPRSGNGLRCEKARADLVQEPLFTPDVRETLEASARDMKDAARRDMFAQELRRERVDTRLAVCAALTRQLGAMLRRRDTLLRKRFRAEFQHARKEHTVEASGESSARTEKLAKTTEKLAKREKELAAFSEIFLSNFDQASALVEQYIRDVTLFLSK